MKTFALYSGGNYQFAGFSQDSMLIEINYWMFHVDDCNWVRTLSEIKDLTKSNDSGVLLIGTRPRTNYTGQPRPSRGITLIWKSETEAVQS